MKRIFAFLVMLMTVIILGALVIPVIAQEDVEPGEGGTLITPNISDDPASFNPIIGADTASSQVYGFLYPAIIGLNPQTGLEEPGVDGAMAESWEYDETGTVLTITLREDLFWNDGTPITSADYLWAVEATRSGLTSSARGYVFETLADGTPAGGKVVSIEAPDEYTVVVTFSEPDCIAFSDVNDITPVPAHIFSELYGTDYALMDEDPRAIPTVTFGPFKDIEFAPGERVSLVDDQSYVDTQLGYIAPGEWIYLSVPDTTVAVERFLAGELTYMGIPANRQAELRGNADFQVYETTQTGFQYMAYNLANPANPQPGLDENGDTVEQEPHPIFGDVRVRQALAHAVDVDAMIEGILQGNGLRINTHTIPTSWVQPDLEPYAFDPDLAKQMLAEAGWVDDDDNNDTPLVCQGCAYTSVDPTFEGSPFTFILHTNSGNVQREQIGETIDAQLGDIGVDVNYEAIEFGTLVDEAQGQTFDAIILGWSLDLPVDPDVSAFYTPEVDVPTSGFGFTSYNNPELNDLLQQARTVTGCAQEDRAALYEQALTILYEDQPYLYLYVGNVMTAAQNSVTSFAPTPYGSAWNIDAWTNLEENN